MYTPVNPSFTILKWGLRGSTLYRHVFVMIRFLTPKLQIFFFWNEWIVCDISEQLKFPFTLNELIEKFVSFPVKLWNSYWYISLELSDISKSPECISITKTCLFKYIENLTTKKWKLSDKKFWYFSCFCSKHRLWVLVRTASMRRF